MPQKLTTMRTFCKKHAQEIGLIADDATSLVSKASKQRTLDRLKTQNLEIRNSIYEDVQRRVREVFEHPLVVNAPLDRTYTVAKLIFQLKMMGYTKRVGVRLRWLETEAKPETILFT